MQLWSKFEINDKSDKNLTEVQSYIKYERAEICAAQK